MNLPGLIEENDTKFTPAESPLGVGTDLHSAGASRVDHPRSAAPDPAREDLSTQPGAISSAVRAPRRAANPCW